MKQCLLGVKSVIQTYAVRLSADLYQIISGHAQHVATREVRERLQEIIETIHIEPTRSLLRCGVGGK